MPDGLLEIVKIYLDITWLDEATDKKISLMIKNAIEDLDRKSGINNNYLIEGMAQSLLLNRVMYERNGALDDFYINYKNEIVAFINNAKAKKYAEQIRNI